MNKKGKPRFLAKSRFALALQCPTKLYYLDRDGEYANLKKEDKFLQALAEGGYQVGELAKCYHPEGIEVKPLEYDLSLHETNKLLESDNVTIFEAAIRYEDFLIRVDILKKGGNRVDLIEVKAKSIDPNSDDFFTRSGYVKTKWLPYLYDVAFQVWVTKQAFPEWDVHPYLLLADKSKIASVDGLNQAFRIRRNAEGRSLVEVTVGQITQERLGDQILVKVPVKEAVALVLGSKDKDPKKKRDEEKKGFDERAIEYADYYKRDERFPPSIGAHCKQCEFQSLTEGGSAGLKSGFKECWSTVLGDDYEPEEPLVFDLWNFRKSDELIRNGTYYLRDLPVDPYLGHATDTGFKFKSKTAKRQYLQIKKTVEETNPQESVDFSGLSQEMGKWVFPLHFLDFETSMVAIPFTAARRPYEQIAFQFSCHTLHEDGRIEHSEWIHREPGKFPNYQFVGELQNILSSDDGTILRYADHENTVLRQIYKQLDADACEKSHDPVTRIGPHQLSYRETMAWIDSITQWRDDTPSGKGEKHCGDRNMVDMLELIRNYYYHPAMKGSNKIKDVLPAIFSTSEFIKDTYSQPLSFGTNLKDYIFWQFDDETGTPKDPYALLPPLFNDIDIPEDGLYLESGEIQEGGAAMIAYAKMQFTDMSDKEREAILKGLLRYCELDTLAMLMIYEHWHSVAGK